MKDPNKNSYLKHMLGNLLNNPDCDKEKAIKYVCDYIEKAFASYKGLEIAHEKLKKNFEEINKLYHDTANALEEYKKKMEKTPAKRKTTKKPQ